MCQEEYIKMYQEELSKYIDKAQSKINFLKKRDFVVEMKRKDYPGDNEHLKVELKGHINKLKQFVYV